MKRAKWESRGVHSRAALCGEKIRRNTCGREGMNATAVPDSEIFISCEMGVKIWLTSTLGYISFGRESQEIKTPKRLDLPGLCKAIHISFWEESGSDF